MRIYKNGAFLEALTLNAADRGFFAARGGKVGLWSAFASRAVMDDFGGGTIAP